MLINRRETVCEALYNAGPFLVSVLSYASIELEKGKVITMTIRELIKEVRKENMKSNMSVEDQVKLSCGLRYEEPEGSDETGDMPIDVFLDRYFDRIRINPFEDDEDEATHEDTDQHDDEWELTETDEMACMIAEVEAVKAADAFTTLIDGMRMDIIGTMLSMLASEESDAALRMLKGMFYAREMKHAAQDLSIIEACSDYCEDIYDFFIESFFETDEIDWFFMEDTINEAVREVS